MQEEWRDIPGHEGSYQVSDLGRVRSLSRRVRMVARGTEATRIVPGRILRPGRMASGHVSVAVGNGNSRLVHALVLEAFVGVKPDGAECRHLNGEPSDNRLSNLAWGTRSDNLRDDKWHGKRRKVWRLTPSDVLQIKENLRSGVMASTVARQYGVSQSTICDIKKGRTHIDVYLLA